MNEQLLDELPNNNGSTIQLNKRYVFWFIVIFITFAKAYAKFLQIIIRSYFNNEITAKEETTSKGSLRV